MTNAPTAALHTLLAPLVLALLVAPAGASIIISEIMSNPAGTDKDLAATPPYDREWVEIYNTGDATIDLAGWQLGNGAANGWSNPFPLGTTLAPGRPLVLAGSAATFDANWGAGLPRIEVGAFPTLGNTSGTVAVRNAAGVVQDTVSYQSSGAWPTTRGSQGNSIALSPHALDATANNAGANWHPSSGGLYGARWVNGGGHGENNGSPGYVPTSSQAPFAASPDAAWSMVVLPDTQNYAKDSRDRPIFSQMTTWIRDRRDEFNIQLVLHEGDIVNQNSQVAPTSGDQSANQQWANARAAMSILDGHVPYVMALGNHDMGTTNAQSRDTQFNSYFQTAQNPLNYTPPTAGSPAGGILRGVYQPGRLDNAYFELNAPDGRNLLVFSLEFLPREAVVAWANSVAAEPRFANHTAVLLTHSYLNANDTLTNPNVNSYGLGGDGNGGVALWNKLVKVNGNFEMTFSGHVGGDGVSYVRSLGDQGAAVHQMLLNTQFETNGGNGWLRILEFLDDGTTVRVRTYSPFLDLARTDPANSFTFRLSPLPAPEYSAADFNQDGAVDGADLTIWQERFAATGVPGSQQGDATGDGSVDGSDFLAWQRLAAPAAASAASLPVPTPAALQLAAIGMTLLRCRRIRTAVAAAPHDDDRHRDLR
ncbi:MAG: lamin tail domain-containing protein [Pirellulales bacterium]|nr:lamin tail domain-containing protein [Pirellulales bacterium]